jgi:hypothetical protein
MKCYVLGVVGAEEYALIVGDGGVADDGALVDLNEAARVHHGPHLANCARSQQSARNLASVLSCCREKAGFTKCAIQISLNECTYYQFGTNVMILKIFSPKFWRKLLLHVLGIDTSAL